MPQADRGSGQLPGRRAARGPGTPRQGGGRAPQPRAAPRNAIDAATTRALTAAFDDLAEDPEVLAVVLTGTGDRAFCAGMDLKAFASGEIGEILSGKAGFAGIAARDFPKPLIAAVNGAALAGGFEIVLACDLVVAADHAFFGIPEVKRGLVAAGGGLIRLARRIPPP